MDNRQCASYKEYYNIIWLMIVATNLHKTNSTLILVLQADFKYMGFV